MSKPAGEPPFIFFGGPQLREFDISDRTHPVFLRAEYVAEAIFRDPALFSVFQRSMRM